MTREDRDQIAEVGNLPPALPPERIAALKASYRETLGLPADAEVTFVQGDDLTTGYLFQPGTFVRLDGGTLVLSGWTWRVAVRRRLRMAWGWVRYGWRWW